LDLSSETEQVVALMVSVNVKSVAVAPEADVPRFRRRCFVVTLSVSLGVTVALLARALMYTHGHLVYVIDDPGIHLAMARNLVDHGTWGVSPGVFEPASSAPGWTLILAGFTAVMGSSVQVVPLLLNLAAGIWILWIFATRQHVIELRRGAWGSWSVALLLPVFGLFLPALALLGMEHTLQTALTLAVLVLLLDLVDGSISRRGEVGLFLLLFAAGCLRLETVFVGVGCAAAVLVATQRRVGGHDRADAWPWRRRIPIAGSLVVVAAAPFALNGVIDRAFGRGFLPNSIVLKTALRGSGLLPSWDDFLKKLNQDALLGVLVLAAIIYLVFVAAGSRGRNAAFAIAFVVTAVLHVAFADIGWWERYQAYLIAAGLLLVLLVLQETVGGRWREAALFSLSIAIVLFSVSRLALLGSVPEAMSNTYRQQYQVGRFLEASYPGQPVAIQDLGYAAFLHDGPVLDLYGLGSHDVLDRLRGRDLDTADLRALTQDHHVNVIAVPAAAYGLRLPPEWIPVEQWDLGQSQVSTGYPSITFFAPDRRRADVLERHLDEFHAQLPAGVVVHDRAQLEAQALATLAARAPGSH
jgi:hypothetical protein